MKTLDAKRCFDVAFSLLATLFFLPLGVLLSLLIYLSSGLPIFYKSQRVGKGGALIFCWKFRTMHTHAEEKLQAILRKNGKLRKEWETYRKLQKDPRITKIGRFLRKTSLDELPQFWNVLKGELSIVGPRPATEEEIKNFFGEKASKILSVRPGLTGIWQTSGRNLLTFKERVALEESYVEKHSLWLDVKIICKTIPLLFFPKGAF